MIIEKEKRENDLRQINNKLFTYLEELYPKSTFTNFLFDTKSKSKISKNTSKGSQDSSPHRSSTVNSAAK